MNAPEMRTVEEVMWNAIYAEIANLLDFCTDEEISGLWRIYAHAPRRMFPLSIDEMRGILVLVQRTVKQHVKASS